MEDGRLIVGGLAVKSGSCALKIFFSDWVKCLAIIESRQTMIIDECFELFFYQFSNSFSDCYLLLSLRKEIQTVY